MDNLDNVKLDDLISNLNEDYVISQPAEQFSQLDKQITTQEGNIVANKINQYIDSFQNNNTELDQNRQKIPQRLNRKVRITDVNVNDNDNDTGIIGRFLADDDIQVSNYKIPKRTIYTFIILVLLGVGLFFVTKKLNEKKEDKVDKMDKIDKVDKKDKKNKKK